MNRLLPSNSPMIKDTKIANERSGRALAAMRANATEADKLLERLLQRVSRDLKTPELLSAMTDSIRQCSGTFEKAYLARVAGRICRAPARRYELIGLAAELFMFAALVVDDWMDGARVRAGQSTIYLAYGPETAILAANCVTELAHCSLEGAVSLLPSPERRRILSIFRKAVLSLQSGQAAVSAMAGHTITSLSVIDRLARLRCGNLISAAMSSNALASGAQEKFQPLLNAGLWIGCALQHRNDIQDFTVAYSQHLKTPMLDLTNRQPNLVTTCLLKKASHMSRVEQLLLAGVQARASSESHILSVQQFEDILEIIHRYGVDRMAEEHLRRTAERALVASRPLGSVREQLDDFCFLLVKI